MTLVEINSCEGFIESLKDRLLKPLLNDNSPYFLSMN